MSQRLILAVAIAVAIAGGPAPTRAWAAEGSAAKTSVAAPAWVEASNRYSSQLMRAQALFSPEDASGAGLAEYDGFAVDLGPDIDARYSAAMKTMRARLQSQLDLEKDERVRQDLAILITSIDNDVAGIELSAKYDLPYVDVPTLVVGGEGDRFTPIWLSQRMAEFIPKAEYVYVPGGSHTAPLERPGLVNAAIDRFLRERVSTTQP